MVISYSWLFSRSFCLPGAILSTAVDVRSIVQQMLDDVEPASGAGLMESTVTSVVSVVDFANFIFQTIQNHFLEWTKKKKTYVLNNENKLLNATLDYFFCLESLI